MLTPILVIKMCINYVEVQYFSFRCEYFSDHEQIFTLYPNSNSCVIVYLDLNLNDLSGFEDCNNADMMDIEPHHQHTHVSNKPKSPILTMDSLLNLPPPTHKALEDSLLASLTNRMNATHENLLHTHVSAGISSLSLTIHSSTVIPPTEQPTAASASSQRSKQRHTPSSPTSYPIGQLILLNAQVSITLTGNHMAVEASLDHIALEDKIESTGGAILQSDPVITEDGALVMDDLTHPFLSVELIHQSC